MHVVHIRLRGSADHFDQDAYAAPSGEAFAIEITNAAFTASGEPLRGTIAISRASDPARATVPGRPHMWTYDARKAIFVAPAVTAPNTRTVEVQALEPGRYVLQDIDGVSHAGDAVLIMGP
jgi:hypothetical protein